MISSQVLASSTDAARYHDSALVEDGAVRAKADNYYIDERAIATWQGEGARILDIEGKAVTKEAFVDHLEGRLHNPKDGQTQDLSVNSKERRLGMDFTVAPPKSVSVVGLVGKDDRVLEAHHKANQAAISWLEKHGAAIRVKENGETKMLLSGNLMYATVEHHTNRENEPHLHNHNVIMAASYDKQAGKWRSLTNDELLRIRITADTVYKRELARELRNAGFDLTFDSKGRDFEIAGISPAVVEQFSARSMQADAWLVQRGVDPTQASYEQRQAAVLASRKAKIELPREQSQAMWEGKANALGVDLKGMIATAMRKAHELEGRDQVRSDAGQKQVEARGLQNARQGVGLAIAHLTERDQTFKGSALEERAIYFTGPDVGIDDIQKAVSELKHNKVLVGREGDEMGVLTTSRAVADELTLQERIKVGKGRGIPVVGSRDEFDQSLAAFEARKSQEVGTSFKLSGEQVNAARNVLMHGDKFQGIQGDAGTGKTAALEFVKEVAHGRGWEMRGIATSTTGARELEKATGIQSTTVAAFMVEKDTQLNALKADLDRTTVELANSSLHRMRVKQIERRDFPATPGVTASPARFVFDNKTGNVFKSDMGVQNPFNRIGHKLLDAAAANSDLRSVAEQNVGTLRERLRVRTSSLIGSAQVAIGKSLVGYEQVGSVEASSARALHEQLAQNDHNRLLRASEILTAKVENVVRTGNAEGRKYILVMDESSLTGTKDSARLSEIAHDLGARVVLQGDTKQHGSVAAGRAFEQIQAGGINLSIIEETRRFDKATPETKSAIERMKAFDFSGAVQKLQITQTMADQIYGKTAELYIDAVGSEKRESVGIVTLTNVDRKLINQSVRAALQQKGMLDRTDFTKAHLDDPKLTEAERSHVRSLQLANVDRVTALRDYQRLGIAREETFSVGNFDVVNNTVTLYSAGNRQITINPAKYKALSFLKFETRNYSAGDLIEARANIGRKSDPNRVANGTRGSVININEGQMTVAWADGKKSVLNNSQIEKIDHAYARTTFKEQGVTTQREILVVSEKGAKIVTRQALYVALTRAKDSVQIVTSDKGELLKNAGKDTEKTTAIDVAKPAKAQEPKAPRLHREHSHQPDGERRPEPRNDAEQVRQKVPQRNQDNELSM